MSNAPIGMNPWTGGPLGNRDRKYIKRVRALEAEIARLREAIGRMQCTCLPYAKPGDGMCDRCMALEADDE